MKKTHWKHNLMKVPEFILSRIDSVAKNKEFYVAVVKKIPQSDIEKGIYKHLSIKFINGKLLFEKEIIPFPNSGKYSKVNKQGKEIIRKDLPMKTKTYEIESPNFGDWSKGSHEVSWEKNVYQREWIDPKLIKIAIDQIAEENENEKIYYFKFQVLNLLKNDQKDLERKLLFNLNLLQENVGGVNIYNTHATNEEYLNTIYVNWEILPPGEKENNIKRILRGLKIKDDKILEILKERYEALEKLKPVAFIHGINSFKRYFGAKFTKDLVVFENLRYGNAIYVMKGKWEILSKKSRIELIENADECVDRIVHKDGWKKILERVVLKRKN